MLRIRNVEEIEAVLMGVSALTACLERSDPGFVEATLEWLGSAEESMRNHRLSVAASIAAIRGAVLVARRHDGQAQGVPRSTSRKAREAQVASFLKEATDLVAAAVRPRRAQLDEAERIMMQVVAVADRIGLIVPIGGESQTAYLQSVLRSIAARQEIASHVVHVGGLLGETDTLVMLDRAISAFRQ